MQGIKIFGQSPDNSANWNSDRNRKWCAPMKIINGYSIDGKSAAL